MSERRWRGAGTAAGWFFLCAHAVFGQGLPPVSLALSSGSISPSGASSLNLTISSTPGSEPAGIQWTLAWPAADVASVSVASGSSLTAAGKSIYCNGRIGMVTCLGVGLNDNPIGNGVVALVSVTLTQTPGSSALPLSIGGTFAVFGSGTPLSMNGSGAAIAVQGWQPPVQAYFSDLATSDLAYTAANLLYAKGISHGCAASPLQFCPNNSVTRGEMATLLVRAAGGDPTSYSAVPYFTDVAVDHPFFPWIQKLYELGITKGCTTNPLMFCPDRSVTRAEMATFTIRGRYGSATPFFYSTLPFFTDEPGTDGFFSYIQKMAELGMGGCSPQLFCSSNAATRGDTALFLVRGLLNQLLPPGTPILTLANPSTVTRGGSGTTILIVGANTHFSNASILNAGPGITVAGLSAINPQTLVVNLTVSTSAATGARSLIVTTGTEEAVLPNGLLVQ